MTAGAAGLESSRLLARMLTWLVAELWALLCLLKNIYVPALERYRDVIGTLIFIRK